MKDPHLIMSELQRLTRRVGTFILTSGENFDPGAVEMKGFNDLVSYVDKEAEKMIVEGCKEILPGSGFITEEGTIEKSSGEEFVWIIDPLDGTTNFIHGLPAYCVSIALLRHGKLYMGVVYEPSRDELFHGIRGNGAYCNESRIQISTKKHLKDSLLATGFPYYDFGRMDSYLLILNDFMQSTHGLRRMGSAAIDLAYTACGRFEGFFEYNLNAWDVAAGALIVLEAGGVVSDFRGGDDFIFGREMIAAAPGVHQGMLQTIGERWKSST